jgi:hypothetical protein
MQASRWGLRARTQSRQVIEQSGRAGRRQRTRGTIERRRACAGVVVRFAFFRISYSGEYLEILAAKLFMEFYQSEWRFQLMRCRRCGVFVIPNRKPRKRYEYGWHCEKCRSVGTATARISKVTKQHRERWLLLAAKASFRWRPENGERSVWIAKEVNKQLELKIRRNSITRNAALIARMAEELSSPVTDALTATDQGHTPSDR